MAAGRSAPRACLVIPALDEELALPSVLAEVPPGLFARIVVVDNGSRDRTAEVALAAGAEVVREPMRGYGRACLAGIAALRQPRSAESALGAGDVIAFCDGDHSDYAADLARVVGPVLAGEAELVIGSRVLGGADLRAMLPQAWFGNRLACLLMRLFFGARYTDLGPMRAIEVAALERLAMCDPSFGWTIEMQLKATSTGLGTLEVPVRYRPRIGQSKITGTVRGTVAAAWKILGWILVWRLRLWCPRARAPRSR